MTKNREDEFCDEKCFMILIGWTNKVMKLVQVHMMQGRFGLNQNQTMTAGS